MAPYSSDLSARETTARPSASGSPTLGMNVPVCVTTCMQSGNITGCAGLDDYVCICTSQAYTDSVADCWAGRCNPTEIAIGVQYSGLACSYYVENGTSGTLPTPIDTTSAPVPWNTDAFFNIQAVMSSICAALFALAIVLGILACRSRAKRDQAMSERSWTGIGSGTAGGIDRKTAGLDFAKSTHSLAWPNAARGRTELYDSTFGMDTTRVGGESSIAFELPTVPPTAAAETGGVAAPRSSFSRVSVGPRRSIRHSTGVNRGFSNRLTLDPVEGEAEAWEMEEKTASSGSDEEGKGSGGKLEHPRGPDSPVTPITPTTIGSRADEIALDDSTTQLHILPKIGTGYGSNA